MTIYPAIDLYEGKVVRLSKGDYAKMTVYSDNPAATARGFFNCGAAALHVVDLEGAKLGAPANFETIRELITQSGLEVQVGGGIRTERAVQQYLELGAKRVILGTAAVREPGFLRQMLGKFGSSIAVSVDVRDGFVAVSGWTELSDNEVMSFCRLIEDMGVGTIICTDISKDGLLSGTNMELYRDLRARLTCGIIASGGVTAVNEVQTLAQLGIDGAILGKALYTGDLKLTDALEAARKGE